MAAQKTRHQYITTRKDVCGGSPVIAGTRFTVRSVVTYVLRQGISPEELVREFRQLRLAQVHAALAYYYDNRAAIDRELADNTEEAQRSAATR